MSKYKVFALVVICTVLSNCSLFRGPPGPQGERGPSGGSGPIIGMVSYIPADNKSMSACEAFGVGKCEIQTPKCLSGKEAWVQLSFTDKGTHTLFCIK